MKRTIIISILLLQAVCCCTPKESLNSAIDLERNDSISIFDLVDSVSVIQLEKTEGSLMGITNKYFYYKNRFYFMTMLEQTFFCFDKSGRSIFVKKGQGRGPEEFTYCGHFGVDPFLDQLMVLVPWGILINYDLDGKFISKTQLPPDLRAYNEVYAIDRDKLLFFTWGYDYYAYYYSKKDSLLSGGYVQTTFDRSRAFPPFGKSYYYNDSIYFNNEGVKHEILNMSDPAHRVVYRWDFGEKNYTEKQIDALVEYYKSSKLSGKVTPEDQLNRVKEMFENPLFPAYRTISGKETERFIITSLSYGGFRKYKNVVLDKLNKKSYVFSETKEGVKLIFRGSGNLVTEIYHENMNDFLKKILSPGKFKIIESYNPETDNPVLIIYHLK